MKILDNITSLLEAFADVVVTAAIDEGKELAGKVAADVEDSFEHLVAKVGQAATKFVTDLFSDDTLGGLEKANLAATQLVEHAAGQGIVMAEHDVTALIKSAYLAVKAKIGSL